MKTKKLNYTCKTKKTNNIVSKNLHCFCQKGVPIVANQTEGQVPGLEGQVLITLSQNNEMKLTADGTPVSR